MRGLHRSWLFWLGLPGVAFIAWAWDGSLRAPTSGKLENGSICTGFINRAGTITLAYISPGDPFLEETIFDLRPLPPSSSSTGFPAAIKKTELPVFAYPTTQWTLAYWFLLLGYLIPWSAAIYWRQHQKKKAISA